MILTNATLNKNLTFVDPTYLKFHNRNDIDIGTDYGRPVKKSLSLHGQFNPKFLGTAEAYFVCHIGPKFQLSLIYAFNGCP